MNKISDLEEHISQIKARLDSTGISYVQINFVFDTNSFVINGEQINFFIVIFIFDTK